MMNILAKFKEINTFIFDVDGVLTDSKLLVTEAGELLRSMNIKDGYAIKLALEKGYHICIITGGKSKGVISRLEGLGITEIYWGIKDKVTVYNEFISKYAINPDHILYMGDDMPDLAVMELVGLPTCPQDAIPELIQMANYISPVEGGKGCVRDVIEKVLKLNNHWE